MPGDLRPASLQERRRFYARRMEYDAAAAWMSRPAGGRVFALILGRHSGRYPRRIRRLTNLPLIIDDLEKVRDLRPSLLRYLPEGAYYDRNVYAPLDETRKARIDYARAWRSRVFRGQELAFDLDPENVDCPIHGDIAAKMARHQGLSFCDWEFAEIRRQAAELFDALARRWSHLRIVFSGRGFHIHVFDADAFLLSRKERGKIAASVARRYAIDEWVTFGVMRLIRRPFSLYCMVSMFLIPLSVGRLVLFLSDEPRALPRF